MAAEYLTVGEFSRTIDALRDDVRSGFDGVNGRLDELNSKTVTHGEAIARHEQRFTGLDTEIRDIKRAIVPKAMSFPSTSLPFQAHAPQPASPAVVLGLTRTQWAGVFAGASTLVGGFAKAMGWI